MRTIVSHALFGLAGVGLVLLAVQLAALVRHLGQAAPRPTSWPAMSILKPLCGVDDGLAVSLERFATLDYPSYELLLGVKSTADAAWPVARAAERRWPCRVRVVIQRGEPGRNPKVNQLITLAAAARHGVLVVSDSNVRVGPGYLTEIAAHLEDPRVGLVTHPISGGGEQRLGSLMDNLHLVGQIAPGVVAAKRVARVDIVVGKSMALRKADLQALGGFAVVKDVLAEDYVLGKLISGALGKTVAVAHRPIVNVSERQSVRAFFRRYLRWSVIHRKSVTLPTYIGEALLNPTFVACGALAARPTIGTALAVGACATLRACIDAGAGRTLGRPGFGLRAAVALPLKDLLVGGAWAIGLVKSTVEWRGNRLRVHAGSRLTPLVDEAVVTGVGVPDRVAAGVTAGVPEAKAA